MSDERAARAADDLERTGAAIDALMRSTPRERWAARPAPDAWSPVVVVHHLLVEERRDFRPRLESTFADPTKEWAPIDPEGWAREVDEGADLVEMLDAFVAERATSLTWLRGLSSPDWGATYQHPLIGALSAADLLASWVMHDALHLRQLLGLHAQAATDFGSTGYAGSW